MSHTLVKFWEPTASSAALARTPPTAPSPATPARTSQEGPAPCRGQALRDRQGVGGGQASAPRVGARGGGGRVTSPYRGHSVVSWRTTRVALTS